VWFWASMPLGSAWLRALDCIPPVAGIRYLRSDLRVECGVGEHAVARVLAFSVLVALGAGFPAGLAWLLGTARNEQLVDPGFHATWGFLFDGYRAPTRTLLASAKEAGGGDTGVPGGGVTKLPVLDERATLVVTGVAPPTGSGSDGKATPPSTGAIGAVRGRRRSSLMPERLAQTWVVSGDSRVWWEAVVLCRKAGVVLLAVTLTNPYLQCVGAALWFLATTALQVRYTPYTKPLFNRLETASLVTTLLTAIISTALLQYNVGVTSAELHPPDAMTGIEWAVTLLLAVMNVGTFIVLAGLWLRAQCARARGIVRRASFATVSTKFTGRVSGIRASFSRRRSSAGGAGALFTATPPPPPTPSLPAKLLLSNGPAAGGAAAWGVTGGGAPSTATENPLHVRAAPAPTGTGTVPLAARQPNAMRSAALMVAAGTTGDAADVSDAPSAAASRRHVVGAPTDHVGGADKDPGSAAALHDPAPPPPAAAVNASAAASSATPAAATPAGSAAAAEVLTRTVAFAATPVVRSRRR